jgi:hypothetical protein
MNAKEHVLLTGAGFTKNFGAPLASEMWSLILGHPALEAAPRVREALLSDFDFESVYNAVMNGQFDTGEKEAVSKAVNDAYGYIDSIVRAYNFTTGAPYPIDSHKVQKLIARFSGTTHEPGFFFTLNQDLLVERKYYNGPRPSLPGIQHRQDWFSSFDWPLRDADRCVLPPAVAPVPTLFAGSGFFYVKLHGSANWSTPDGQRTMVIGRAKDAQITSVELISRYLDAFKSVLCGGRRRLLCIGYGFADPHINDVIADGVRSGLGIFVLSPVAPHVFKAHLQHQHRGDEIWSGLAAYFPFDLKTLFPADQSITDQWKLVSQRFFGHVGGY